MNSPDASVVTYLSKGQGHGGTLHPVCPLTGAALKGDGRDWARRIKARYEAGEQINPTTLRFAREGLATVGESI